MRPGAFALTAVVTAGVLSAAYETAAERINCRRFPPPGHLVEVDGRRLHVWCEGQRGPTVVVVPGINTSCLEWVGVQRELLKMEQRVCLYDRSGYGWSDWVPGARTPSRMADELAAVLQAGNVPAPYVLVGASLGGEVIRLYAARHLEKVAGMVFVDASHEDAEERFAAEFGRFGYGSTFSTARWAFGRFALPRGLARVLDAAGVDRRTRERARREVPPDLADTFVALELTSRHRRAAIAEIAAGKRRRAREMRAERRTFGDMPLTVITAASVPAAGTVDWRAGINDRARRVHEVKMPLQRDLLSLSTRGEHIVAKRAGHNLQHDEGDLVVSAVADMCDRLRSEGLS